MERKDGLRFALRGRQFGGTVLLAPRTQQTSGPSAWMEPRLAPRRELYCTVRCHGNNSTKWWCEVARLSQTRSPRPGCQAAWGKALRALTDPFFSHSPPSYVQLPSEGQTSAPHFYAVSEATCVNLCGLFEAGLWLVASRLPSLWCRRRSEKAKLRESCTIKNCFLDFYVLIRYSLWNAVSVFLLLAAAPQTMKVFNKKRTAPPMIFASARPRERKTMGSSHLPLGALHFTGAMKRQRQLSTGQSNYTNSWPTALLSLARSPSPSPCLLASICPPLYTSFTQTPSSSSTLQVLHVIPRRDGTTERTSVPLLPPRRQIFTVLPWFILG